MQNPLFKSIIENKTGVKMEDIMELAQSVQHANLKDEATVRNLIQQVAKLANKPIKKDMEDQIVKAIVNDSNSMNMDTVMKMLDKKK